MYLLSESHFMGIATITVSFKRLYPALISFSQSSFQSYAFSNFMLHCRACMHATSFFFSLFFLSCCHSIFLATRQTPALPPNSNYPKCTTSNLAAPDALLPSTATISHWRRYLRIHFPCWRSDWLVCSNERARRLGLRTALAGLLTRLELLEPTGSRDYASKDCISH